MAAKVQYISEQEAVNILGLENKETLRRLIRQEKLFVRYAQITRKSERRYLQEDIDLALRQNIVTPGFGIDTEQI